MSRANRVLIAFIAVGVFAAAVTVIVLVVAVPGDRRCSGVDLRSATAPADTTVRDRPRIVEGAVVAKLRAALRGDQQVAFCEDFADPFVLQAGGTFYAYSTNSGDFKVPVLTGGGLITNAPAHEALPQLPGWSPPIAGRVWAPSVLPRSDAYVLYYTTAFDDGQQCISRAVATRPQGPFRDETTAPLICPTPGGAIDPSPFVDRDGRAYLLWKDASIDAIVAQELTPDGLSLIGTPSVLIEADQEWEAGVVEGPSLTSDSSAYYLFYSANDWTTALYAVGYARCDTPLGPCTKPLTQPWLAASESAQGPGGPEVFVDENSEAWMVLHAWVGGQVGYPDGARNLFVLRLEFSDGQPIAA